MRRTLLVAGFAALVAAPSLAQARDPCQQRAHDRKVAGTVIGAVGGALVGGAVGDTKGAVIGGVGGAVVGNNLARVKCDRGASYRAPARSAERAPSRSYQTAASAPRCHYENRRYYNERGQTIYSPTQVCR